MKYVKTFAASIAIALSTAAYSAENVSVLVGETKEISHPLQIDSYKITPKDKASVEGVVDKKKIRILGKSEGVCTLDVFSGDITKSYTVTVVSQLRKLLTRLRFDLDSIQGLDISINQDYIVIKGKVSKPEQWAHLERVVSLYKDSVQNFASFEPTTETIFNLKKMLTEAGFTFKSKDKDGQLDLQMSPDAVMLSGEVYSDEALAKIKQIISTQRWLTYSETPPSGTMRCIFNVSVKPVMLEIDAVYVALTDSEIERLGTMAVSSSLKAGVGALTSIFSGFNGSAGRNSAGIDIGLDPFSAFMAENGIDRIYQAGHLTFLSNDKEGGKLHTGGTLHVKVSGVENGSLQEIDEGLKLQIKGGLIDSKNVKLNVDFSFSSVKQESEDSFREKKEEIKNTVVGELNKTIILGGAQRIDDAISNGGTALLRNIPVIKWFTSQDSSDAKDLKLVILLCPRIMGYDENSQIKQPIRNSTAPIYNEVKSNNDETAKSREERKSDGGLFSL